MSTEVCARFQMDLGDESCEVWSECAEEDSLDHHAALLVQTDDGRTNTSKAETKKSREVSEHAIQSLFFAQPEIPRMQRRKKSWFQLFVAQPEIWKMQRRQKADRSILTPLPSTAARQGG